MSPIDWTKNWGFEILMSGPSLSQESKWRIQVKYSKNIRAKLEVKP